MVGVLPTLITVYPRSLSFTVEPQEHGGLSLAALGMGHDNFKRGESTGSGRRECSRREEGKCE